MQQQSSSGNKEQQGGSNAAPGSALDRYTVQPKQEDDKSPFYKSAAPAISMPKGGGALKGIDEKFSVNAVNGTAGLEIPLPLSPGRGGFTPALSLSYSSGGGNSECGLGWNLSIPGIQRRTDKKLPRYADYEESDVFLLAGAEDLVPELDGSNVPVVFTAGSYTIKRYRPRIEGLFARIEFIVPTGQRAGWWRVMTKDNITTYYGLTANARLADPENAGRIFRWLPQLTLDHKGNVQLYTYIAEDLRSVLHTAPEANRLNGNAPVANTYLKRVQYCNKTPWYISEADIYQPALPAIDWLMEAALDYGDHSSPYNPAPDQPWPVRHDAFSDFHAGFEIRTWRLLRRVLMFHRFSELNSGAATLVRSLVLQYRNDALAPGVLSEADLITKAIQTGHRQQGMLWQEKSLPAMTFSYEALNWNTDIVSVSKDDARNAPQGLTGPYQWIDFEGEGISGILTEQGGGWFYKNNLGDGHFAGAKEIGKKPSFAGLGSSLQWQDLDADGRRQVVVQEPVKGYWELAVEPAETAAASTGSAPGSEVVEPAETTAASTSSAPTSTGSVADRWQPFRAFARNLNIDLNSPFVKSLDLDGDGRPDLLLTEDRAWTWYASEGTKGWSRGGGYTPVRDEEKGPVLLLRDAVQSIFLADMNGDGLTDLVRIRNGEVCYWPNMGYGRFGAKVTMSGAPQFQSPDLFNPMYLTLADISGTGAADIIFVGKNKCTAWINQAGNGWGGATDINPMPGTDAYSKIAVLDFLGNGTGCIVWSSPLPHYADAPMRYIDLMGGNKPYLLKSYSSGMGKTVSVTYRSSTKYYLDDKLSGRPWATKLPFPVHCISQVTTLDTVSETSYTQLYRYRHGYYDHEEREFRGFGYVETTDTDKADITNSTSLDQWPVQTRTWYHTGAWMRYKQLTDHFKEEYYHFDGWDDLAAIAQIPAGMSAQETREAYRALKGQPLRQEVYALDGSTQQGIPYSVTATAYEVKKIQPLGPNRYASFMSLQQQQVGFSCERDAADPRILHSLTLATDTYGNVLHSAQVAYPRRVIPGTLPLKVRTEQALMHITTVYNDYTNDVISTTAYRLRLPYRSRSFEVVLGVPVGGALWTGDILKAAIDAATERDFSQTVTTGQKRWLSHSRTLFKNNLATAALANGVLESLALPHEQYALAFTGAILTAAYGSRVAATMLTEGGYIDLDSNGGYWLPSGKAVYSSPATNFYTPVSFTDPWGNSTTVSYWGSYWLLPQSTADALGNTMSITAYDWYSLQPLSVKDSNDNLSDMLYDALGMPVAMALRGKGTEGDTLAGMDPGSSTDLGKQVLFWNNPGTAAADLLHGATWRCVYDLEGIPAAVAMIAREQHASTGSASPMQMRFTYSDGFGRVLMHKAQCEPNFDFGSKPWVGSGRTIYNNKGNAVMQYEPYFSSTHACDTAEQAASAGVTPKIKYDALNRACRTDLPDDTFTKTEWTAWEQTTWDNNDTVLSSAWYTARIGGGMGAEEQEAAQKAAVHAYTPTIVHTDTLARPFYTIQMLVADPVAETDTIDSYVRLDIQGNRLSVTDGRGLVPLSYGYNMLQQVCSQQSIDSGNGYTLTDAAGQPLYGWDADDRKFRFTYDVLRRQLRKEITESSTTTCAEKMIYGEGLTDDKLHNYRGQLYRHYDGSGLQQVNKYDFKGNLLSTQQQLLQDHTISDVNWDAAPVLSTEIFTASVTYDALSRPVSSTDPGGNITVPTYDKSGALVKVELNGTPHVQNVKYDAKGQRQSILYGNNTVTKYTYDANTFRLKTLLTTGNSGATIYQELYYYYDPVGNITQVRDNVLQTIFFNNAVISPTQKYTYDALYRLIKAQGRELIGTASFGTDDNTQDTAWKTAYKSDGNAVQSYTQNYTYDAVGNILSLQHIAGTGSYTRTFNIGTVNNRLTSTVVGASTYNYTLDVRGNISVMPHLSTMGWNQQNELKNITKGTMNAWYQYGGGQRVRKYVNKAGIKEERIYLGNYEIYRKFDASSLKIVERVTLHVSDDTGRIAMLENRTFGTQANDNNTAPSLIRYIYSNHLQSASLELNHLAEIISYEEYHPYGTTSYQAMNASIQAVAKRYRYTGKERDEESGLYYHGARYYIPWLCRWTAVDPLESKYAGMSPYNYSFNNPIVWNDPSGMGPEGIPAPKLVDGTTANYTFTSNVYDHKGNLVKSQSDMFSNEIEGLAHGEYVQNTTLADPARPEIRDGDLVVANSDYKGKIKFTPYVEPSLTEQAGDFVADLWERYKTANPIEAGVASGTWNFVSSTVGGIANAIAHPIETTKGLYAMYNALNGSSGGFYFPESYALRASLVQAGADTWNKFQNGDAYTKTSMGTEAALTVASFFVGTGESKAVDAAGRVVKGAEAYNDYNLARNAALKWLDARGFKAETPNIAKMRLDPNKGRAIGMTDQTGKIGFRVEYGKVDGVMTPHINVFDKTVIKSMQEGPHFTFPGSQNTVNTIIKRFNKK